MPTFSLNSTLPKAPFWRTGVALLMLLSLALGGCATTNSASSKANPRDPLEGFNRAVFAVNDELDKGLLKPLAQGYDQLLSAPVKTVVSNFFGNLEDLSIAVNNLLQGKFVDAASDVGRVAVNSTIGIFGLSDVASYWGLTKHDEDFGQTFGYWGAGDGPYLMLPLLGPSTVRDGLGKILDQAADPINYVQPDTPRYALSGIRLLKTRAELLPADKVIEAAALDKYSYLRDAYLQRRRYLVYDGDPPRQREEE